MTAHARDVATPRRRAELADRTRSPRRRLSFVLLLLAPLVVVPAIFVAVLRAPSPAAPLVRRSIPDEPRRADRCTWACHNRGCKHRPRLPLALAGDDGLFGATIRALQRAGGAVSAEPGVGYGAVNLAVFCAAWPAAMYVLYVVALRQRRRLREGD